MALDLAPDALTLILISFLETIYFIGPVIFFKIKKWDVKYEIVKRICPMPTDSKKKLIEILKGIVYGILFLVLAWVLSTSIRIIVISLLSEEVYQIASDSSVNTTPPSINYIELVIIIILNYVLIAFCEEFFYRGVIFEHLKQKDPKKAALISSLLFALYHVPPGIVPLMTTIIFFPYYFVFGYVLAKIVHSSEGNLLTAIIAHGTFNSILWLM